MQLITASPIGLRPGQAVVAEIGGGLQRPIWIGEVRPRQAHEIGAPGHQNGIDVVGVVDISDRKRRDLLTAVLAKVRQAHAVEVNEARVEPIKG